MEFSDAVSAGDTTGLDQTCINFLSGKAISALRPDVTTPVARVVATRLKEQPKPIVLLQCQCFAMRTQTGAATGVLPPALSW